MHPLFPLATQLSCLDLAPFLLLLISTIVFLSQTFRSQTLASYHQSDLLAHRALARDAIIDPLLNQSLPLTFTLAFHHSHCHSHSHSHSHSFTLTLSLTSASFALTFTFFHFLTLSLSLLSLMSLSMLLSVLSSWKPLVCKEIEREREQRGEKRDKVESTSRES